MAISTPIVHVFLPLGKWGRGGYNKLKSGSRRRPRPGGGKRGKGRWRQGRNGRPGRRCWTMAPGCTRRRGPASAATRCCWPGSPAPAPATGRWTWAAAAASWRCAGMTKATGAPAPRWSWTPGPRPSARRRWRRAGRSWPTSRRSAAICGSSAPPAPTGAATTLRPATRPTSPAAPAAPTPGGPPPATSRPAPWRMWPPARPGRCGSAGGSPSASGRKPWPGSARRSAPPGWNPSGWPLCATAPAPPPGSFCWKPAAAAARALCCSPTS